MSFTLPVFSKRDVWILIRRESYLYRRVELIDIYKLLFQAYYGPTHMDAEFDTIRENIIAEIKSIDQPSTITHHDIGVGKAFVRVGLSDMDPCDMKSIDALAQTILASKLEGGIPWKHWFESWSNAISVVSYIYPAHQINKLWTDYVLTHRIPSHSEIYKQKNKPHYRIIRRELCPWFVNPL